MKSVLLNTLMAIGGENINEDEYALLIDIINEVAENDPCTIQEIADRNYVSTATVSRLCKKFNFGFRELKQFLKDEMNAFNKREQSTKLNPNYSIRLLHQVMNDNLQKTFDHLNEKELWIVIERIQHSSNIAIIASGISQIAGNYLCQRLQIIGKQATFWDIGLSAGIFVNQINHADLVIIISRSGESKVLMNKIQIAKKLQKTTLVIGCEKSSTFGKSADLSLPIHGSKRSLDQSNQVTTYNLSVFFLIDVLINNLLDEWCQVEDTFQNV